MEIPANLIPDEASPEWMNKADNAWQLTAATLVGLQSIPGLVILYGSMVKKKWAVNSAFMAFYAFAAVLVCWVGWGFRMSFGEKLVVFLGKPAVALDEKFLLGQAFLGLFPTATMVFYHGMFAGLTLILVAGALLGRMNFVAWMLFVPLWVTFSYTVVAFSIWCPDGWLAKLGVIDYAGGFVVHLSAGVAGFTAAFWVGPRTGKDRERFPPPNNMILMLAGAGLLWMGWSGFNGGDPYVASTVASLAVLNTHVCAATSLLMWVILDTVFSGKPSLVGAVQGMITGLVKILKHVDDPMAVFHTHAIAGSLGGILAGLFATPKLSRIFFMVSDWDKYIGLLYGLQSGRTSAGFRQMGLQLGGILFVIVVNVVVTSLICLFIQLFVPLRLNDDELEIGDGAVHGEEAFVLIDGEKRSEGFEINAKRNMAFDVEEYSSVASRSIVSELQLV
ncbi:hypothetical protein CsatB_028849 [Cannabis sativa]